jgi:hypothetical protein
MGYDRFLPKPFQFIIHQSSYHSPLERMSLNILTNLPYAAAQADAGENV